MKILAAALILSFATCAHAQSAATAIDVTGEHGMASGDTADSAKQLARVDAQIRAWSTAVARLQGRDDVKALRLTPVQVEAFTAVLLDLEEQPPSDTSAVTRRPVQVRLRGSMDAGQVVQRIALLLKDQDVTFDLVEAWGEMRQLLQQLSRETQLRAGLPTDKASALAQNQLKTVVALNVKHLSARASAALARTEPSAIGGRASSDAGRR